MAVKKKGFNTLDPRFPKKAMMALILIRRNDSSELLFALKPIFDSFNDLIAALEASEKEFNNLKISLEGAIILPIRLKKKINLKKEYWKNPTIQYSSEVRMKALMEVIKSHRLYQLLVLPEYYDKKNDNWFFTAALPFYITAGTDEVEKFMMTAKDPVDKRAKYAGMYLFDKPKGLTWPGKVVNEMTDEEADDLENLN